MRSEHTIKLCSELAVLNQAVQSALETCDEVALHSLTKIQRSLLKDLSIPEFSPKPNAQGHLEDDSEEKDLEHLIHCLQVIRQDVDRVLALLKAQCESTTAKLAKMAMEKKSHRAYLNAQVNMPHEGGSF